MKLFTTILFLLLLTSLKAQDIRYSIHFPSGSREGIGSKSLPNPIDTSNYYSYREIRDLAKPANGWTDFYEGVDKLVYPKTAKIKKLQTSLTIEYRIDANGLVDSVFIRHREAGGRWTKCVDCEKLILDYFRNTKWIPGKIEEVPVKTTDYSHLNSPFTSLIQNKHKVHSGINSTHLFIYERFVFF